MSTKEIIINIMIPLLTSVINVAVVLYTVLVTIRNENNNRIVELKYSLKPYFYVINQFQSYDYKHTKEYYFFLEKSEHRNRFFQIIMHNTDNAIMLLDYIKINDEYYYPKYGDAVDKNDTFMINIYISDNIDLVSNNNTILLSVNDVLQNNYIYNIDYSIENNKLVIDGIIEKK